MTTLSDLNQECRLAIGDNISGKYIFSNDQINAWINAALRELSQKFPRQIEYTLSTTKDQRVYDLEIVHTAALSCEYPSGSEPPVYLTRRSYTDPDFWTTDGLYDFVKHLDADSLNPPRLMISAKPGAGETITLQLLCEHNPLLDPGDVTTVQERHLNLVALFVHWRVWQEREANWGLYPTIFSVYSGAPYGNAARAAEAYRRALEEAVRGETSSAVSVWRMDRFEGGG